ncbi:hypothetical protein [Nocardioides flavescens]|uniref:Uncharacterized protein n=1 Tax=Nocardioides flavescens TaxID=2691959 RepID=A0A6L7F2L6_9ACTN|nr:hypothetical protein [Nocardioides flavescens]MXG89734.1 hypothetical protein [Nocardioides flavescens]
MPTEILYLTRADGSMSQVRVEETKGKPRVRTLQIASTGYAGVTELAWSVCVKPRGAASLIAVVPSEDRATWTTVARVGTEPRDTL